MEVTNFVIFDSPNVGVRKQSCEAVALWLAVHGTKSTVGTWRRYSDLQAPPPLASRHFRFKLHPWMVPCWGFVNCMKLAVKVRMHKVLCFYLLMAGWMDIILTTFRLALLGLMHILSDYTELTRASLCFKPNKFPEVS